MRTAYAIVRLPQFRTLRTDVCLEVQSRGSVRAADVARGLKVRTTRACQLLNRLAARHVVTRYGRRGHYRYTLGPNAGKVSVRASELRRWTRAAALAADGLPADEIAALMGMNPRTVRGWVRNRVVDLPADYPKRCALRAYRNGRPFRVIRKVSGCDIDTLMRWLREERG